MHRFQIKIRTIFLELLLVYPIINIRIVKFDICERFDMLDEMRQIINFFEQPEYKNKYHNNIISFKAILLAKEGQIDEAVDFFRGNIRDYTEDAKDKFIAKLERYKDE